MSCISEAGHMLENAMWPSERECVEGRCKQRWMPSADSVAKLGFCDGPEDLVDGHLHYAYPLYNALLKHQCMYDSSNGRMGDDEGEYDDEYKDKCENDPVYYYEFYNIMFKCKPADVELTTAMYTLISHIGDINRNSGGGMISRAVDKGGYNLLHVACMTRPFNIDFPNPDIVRALLDACVDDAERLAAANAKSVDGHTPFTLLMAYLGECEIGAEKYVEEHDAHKLSRQAEPQLVNTLTTLLQWTNEDNRNARFDFCCDAHQVTIIGDSATGTALDVAYLQGYPCVIPALLYAGVEWTDGFEKATEHQGGSVNSRESAEVTLDALLDPALPAPTRNALRDSVIGCMLQNVNSS